MYWPSHYSVMLQCHLLYVKHSTIFKVIKWSNVELIWSYSKTIMKWSGLFLLSGLKSIQKTILTFLFMFHWRIPFTIQRLCELLTDPRRNYTGTDKFLRGVEKVCLSSGWIVDGHFYHGCLELLYGTKLNSIAAVHIEVFENLSV